MRYMLLIYGDDMASANASPEERKQGYDAYDRYTKWLAETDQATTVRVRGEETLTTDGPFAETKEQLGGYYIVDCEDLDQAIEAAAECPGARYGSMEVRPIIDLEAPPA